MQLKTWFLNMPASDGIHPLPGLVVRAMTLAQQAEIELDHSQMELLDELDRIVDQVWQPIQGHWVREVLRGVPGLSPGNDFLSLAESYKLRHYVREKIFLGEDISIDSRRSYLDLLSWTKPPSNLSPDVGCVSSLERNKKLLEILLGCGCDPNRDPKNNDYRTPWQAVLFELLHRTPIPQHMTVWSSIISTFLLHGANRNTILNVGGHQYAAKVIIVNAFSPHLPEECRALLRFFPQPVTVRKPEARKGPGSRVASWMRRKFS